MVGRRGDGGGQDMPNLMADFGTCFCDDGDSRGKSRGRGVEIARRGGRMSDMAPFLQVAAEHRSERRSGHHDALPCWLF